ncbi:MAG: hypothetical protein F4Y04_07555 [Chloroflexi bacterium]|nr:hypothetical protein [Chloroflexota bacterium]
MRTTIRLDDALLRDAKSYAAAAGMTLTTLIEESLRARMTQTASEPRKRVRLLTSGAEGMHPGIDLDNASTLVDARQTIL